MADKEQQYPSYYQPVDVSKPVKPRKEIEIIEEQIALRRRAWIKRHMHYIYAAVGIVLVALIALFIHFYYQNTNPMSRFVSASGKDFGTSFDFVVDMRKNDVPVMSYDGAVDIDRSAHSITALYDATYSNYFYKAAVYADQGHSVKGSFFNGKWTIDDASDEVMDFFDFDGDYSRGGFDAGAFLRFIGLTSDYSSSELDRFATVLRDRLSTDSSVATITSHKIEDGMRYDYAFDLHAMLKMVADEGASLFYRSTDYDRFKARYEANIDLIRAAKLSMSFTVDTHGYMSAFSMELRTGGDTYRLNCRMSDFGQADVAIPNEFFKAAEITAPID